MLPSAGPSAPRRGGRLGRSGERLGTRRERRANLRSREPYQADDRVRDRAERGSRRARRLGDVLEDARGTASEAISLELLLAHRAGLEAHLPLYEPLVSRRSDAIGACAPTRLPMRDAPSRRPRLRARASHRSTATSATSSRRGPRAGGSRRWTPARSIERRVVRCRSGGGTSARRARSLVRPSVALRRRASVRPRSSPWRGGEVRGVVHDENAWALTGRADRGTPGCSGRWTAVLAFGCAALDAIERSEGPLLPAAERPDGSSVRGRAERCARGSTARATADRALATARARGRSDISASRVRACGSIPTPTRSSSC